jgi:hypothetical protein
MTRQVDLHDWAHLKKQFSGFQQSGYRGRRTRVVNSSTGRVHARAAAVGSSMTRDTASPAAAQAPFVSHHSLKYARTVITRQVYATFINRVKYTGRLDIPAVLMLRYCSAAWFICVKTTLPLGNETASL